MRDINNDIPTFVDAANTKLRKYDERIFPAALKAHQHKTDSCKEYVRTGTCRFGDKCLFLHIRFRDDQPESLNCDVNNRNRDRYAMLYACTMRQLDFHPVKDADDVRGKVEKYVYDFTGEYANLNIPIDTHTDTANNDLHKSSIDIFFKNKHAAVKLHHNGKFTDPLYGCALIEYKYSPICRLWQNGTCTKGILCQNAHLA
jgi:hypothetical protein